jgi:hypothetical protein
VTIPEQLNSENPSYGHPLGSIHIPSIQNIYLHVPGTGNAGVNKTDKTDCTCRVSFWQGYGLGEAHGRAVF